MRLAVPRIIDASHNHTEIGDSINLSCSLEEQAISINFHWTTPRGTFNVSKKFEYFCIDLLIRQMKQNFNFSFD